MPEVAARRSDRFAGLGNADVLCMISTLRFRRLFWAFMLCLAVCGCGRNGSQSGLDPDQAVALPPGVHLDPALGVNDSAQLTQDIAQLGSLPVTGEKIKYFEDIFGGPTSQDVAGYFGERVHWILAHGTDVERLLVLQAVSTGLDADDDKPQVVASNVGTAIWYTTAMEGLPPATLSLGSNQIQIGSTRAGVIQLGSGYTKDPDMSVLRISTLIHEARHSDCTGGVHISDLSLLKDGKEPESRRCGHMHVKCPTGHPYAGYAACDQGDPFGAYSVEAVYLAALARACSGCSNIEQKTAFILFSDAASRVLDLEKELSGQLGRPDMSSSNVVVGGS